MKYKTCVTVAESNPKRMAQNIRKALKGADYAEARLDFLKPDQIPESLEEIKKELKRIVCTVRTKKEGGKFSTSQKERVSILKLVSEYDPFLIDVEYNTLKANTSLRRFLDQEKVLLSWHDFNKTPTFSKLSEHFKNMRKIAKNVKIVTTAKNIGDVSNVLSLYSIKSKTNLIAFAMGDAGRMSRVLCLYLGSPYTYVSLGKTVAPGQFSLGEMKSIIGIKKHNKFRV